MKSCPKCQTSVSDTAKFCVRCGFNIKKYEEESAQELFCPECGTKFSGGTFCPECGYNVSKDLAPEAVSNSAEEGLLDLSEMNAMAIDQLYEKEGFVVENGVLMAYNGKKRNITIKGTIEEIYDGAFENNNIITFVKIEEGVRLIGKRAFANCGSLVKISIPDSVEKIYDDAFSGTAIETLTLSSYNLEIIRKCVKSYDFLDILDIENFKKYIREENGVVTFDVEKYREAKFKFGKRIKFGEYEWYMLSRNKNKMLLFCCNIVDYDKPYNATKGPATWETCTLRKWLNNVFINLAFDSEERERIQLTRLYNPDDEDEGTPGGNPTDDKVFILSADEAEKYLSNIDAEDGAWVRSPVNSSSQARLLGDRATAYSGYYVQPAIWIEF